jgi:signal transduction histidine kinase
VIDVALVVGGATLVAGVAGSLAAARLPTLRLQLAALGLVSVVLPLAAVTLSGVLMFRSDHDLTILAVAAASALAAVGGALLLGRRILARLEALREASARVAAGDLGARAPETPPAELAEVGRGFNEMAGAVERLFDARRQLVAGASHDLRTPLAALQAMVEAMQDGVAPPERYLGAVAEQVQVLAGRVDDLFELARIDAGALSLELREADLGAVVATCVRGAQAQADARRVALSAHVEPGAPAVRFDPREMERVLQNLLANALRHTPADGTVAVRLGPAEDGVWVSVEDTGEGIPEEALGQVFERFWRGDPARVRDPRSGDGAGLGLAIARGLVEAHGGRIWAENRPGGGARVTFTLPAAG